MMMASRDAEPAVHSSESLNPFPSNTPLVVE
jgi:hypothetical protein